MCGNRLTDREVIDFESLCSLWDYADYIEEMVSGGDIPLIYLEWLEKEI